MLTAVTLVVYSDVDGGNIEVDMSKNSDGSGFDVILIGSGMGALTVASLMAQLRHKRVLILEKHFKLGGFTHTFQRKGFQWDVGLHYVGEMAPGEMPRKLFDLVTHHGVQWQPMPHVFEKFVYPDLTFAVPSDPECYQKSLVQAFPHEAAAIQHYFQDVQRARTALSLYSLHNNSRGLTRLFMSLARRWQAFDLTLTTQAYLDQHFTDPQLKALLVSQWLDYGLPPAESPFALHATIVGHYLKGAYYPVGGAARIAESIQPLVEAEGGQILLNHEVTRILVQNGRAVGVRVRSALKSDHSQTRDYLAPVIISNAGAVNTYLKLVPPEVSLPFRDRLRTYMEHHPPATTVCLYLGLSRDPRALGFQGENYWIHQQFHHGNIQEQSRALLQGDPQHLYLSFPSLKDPEAVNPTAEILAPVDYRDFAPWKDQPWRHRDPAYRALKQRIQESLLDRVEHHYPGFRDRVEYAELSTPLTNEHFTAHPQGAIYGLPFAQERLQSQNAVWTRARTPLPGLYLTGVDLFMGGIVPALFSGLMTVSQIPDGISLPALFVTAAHQPSRPYGSIDHRSQMKRAQPSKAVVGASR